MASSRLIFNIVVAAALVAVLVTTIVVVAGAIRRANADTVAYPDTLTVTTGASAYTWTTVEGTHTLSLGDDGVLTLATDGAATWTSAAGLVDGDVDADTLTAELSARGTSQARIAQGRGSGAASLWVRGRWFFVGTAPWPAHAWWPVCGSLPLATAHDDDYAYWAGSDTAGAQRNLIASPDGTYVLVLTSTGVAQVRGGSGSGAVAWSAGDANADDTIAATGCTS